VATRGKIIVIEGTDKAGKGSQSRMLAETLKASGKVCVILDFPDYTTPIGMEIKAFLEDKRDYLPEVKHLLFSANRWQSNLVYGVANGIETNWLLRLDKGLPKEDIVLVILVNPSISAKRAEIQDMFESDPQLAAKAYKNYLKFAKQYRWKVLDGSKSKEQVHQEITKIIRKELKV
jgi:dTMP kinase